MDAKQNLQALAGLKKFIQALTRAGVKDKAGYRQWRAGREKFMEKCFGYRRREKMLPITSLVTAFFHPTLPLIGLNYTQAAFNTLHAYPDGWTAALRLCRGIIFDRGCSLVAKPFDKFFNYNEHEETKILPDEPFTATTKHDGHLGIIFEHGGGWHITTRGDFGSRTSKLGSKMLKDYARRGGWAGKLPAKINPLVEIIDPSTKIHLRYRGSRFILIGAYDRETLRDFDYAELQDLGKLLGLPVTERWSGDSIKDLVALMRDLSVRNREGFVVRFRGGLRVKFKFASYINMMVESKLSYGYVMKRLLDGNLDKMIRNLPEEIYGEARTMVDAILKAEKMPGTVKERRQYLYGLVPPEKSKSHYRGICRKLLKKIDAV